MNKGRYDVGHSHIMGIKCMVNAMAKWPHQGPQLDMRPVFMMGIPNNRLFRTLKQQLSFLNNVLLILQQHLNSLYFVAGINKPTIHKT